MGLNEVKISLSEKFKKIFRGKEIHTKELSEILTFTQEDIIRANERMMKGEEAPIVVHFTQEEINAAYRNK